MSVAGRIVFCCLCSLFYSLACSKSSMAVLKTSHSFAVSLGLIALWGRHERICRFVLFIHFFSILDYLICCSSHCINIVPLVVDTRHTYLVSVCITINFWGAFCVYGFFSTFGDLEWQFLRPAILLQYSWGSLCFGEEQENLPICVVYPLFRILD